MDKEFRKTGEYLDPKLGKVECFQEISLCPICGEKIVLMPGETKDGRLIGSCGDAFTEKQFGFDVYGNKLD